MSAESNAAIVRRYVEEVLNQQNLAALDSLLAPGFVHGAEGRGITGQAAALRSRFKAFPDARVTIQDLMADDRQVAIRATWSGTHREQWLGVPASNRPATWGIMAFFEIRDGRISHLWAIEDAAELQRQLKEAQAQQSRAVGSAPGAL